MYLDMTATWPPSSVGLPVRLAADLPLVGSVRSQGHHSGTADDDFDSRSKSITTVRSSATSPILSPSSPPPLKFGSRKAKHPRSSFPKHNHVSADHGCSSLPAQSPSSALTQPLLNPTESNTHAPHIPTNVLSSPSPRNHSLTTLPIQQTMAPPEKTIAIINSSGRQAASFIRVATAVGYHVRAQLRNLLGVVATEVATNPNVTILVGELYTRHRQCPGENTGCPAETDPDDVTQQSTAAVGVNYELITDLFRGAQLAFINTTYYGDEVKLGRAIVDTAIAVGIEHFIYSSMPDHSAYNPAWPALPLWASKHMVEEYVRASGLPSTFVYTGIYNNNFTSLPYPLFCTEIQPDGSFIWQAPFHPDVRLPWLDAEHDVGPAILQIFKDGVAKWGGRRIGLAYQMLSPLETCEVFSRGLGRPVRYVQGPIELTVPIPAGYRRQLEALEVLFSLGHLDPALQPPYFGDADLERNCPAQALDLWAGPRLLEEYAREVFPLEERANGLAWMLGNRNDTATLLRMHVLAHGGSYAPPRDDDPVHEQDAIDDWNDDGLVIKASRRHEETWLA